MPKNNNDIDSKFQPSDNKTTGIRIAEARKSKNLTQQELADQLGITRELLCNYELSRNRIFAEMIYRIAVTLEVSADSLLGLEEIEDS